MPNETAVTLRLDAASLFQALKAEIGPWRLDEHTFDPSGDELKVSVDPGGTARIAVTVNFELDQTQFARILKEAQPAT